MIAGREPGRPVHPRPRRRDKMSPELLPQRTLQSGFCPYWAAIVFRGLIMHTSRILPLLAFMPFLAVAAPATDETAEPAACAGPSLPFYAYAVHGGNKLAR